MVDGVDTSETARPQSSAAEAWERSDSLVRIRWASERGRIDAVRIGRSMIGFAALWALVPIVEGALVGGLSVAALVLHFGVVMPWAVIVGVGAGVNRSSARADVAAGLVVLTACFVTLVSHRIGDDVGLRAFDTLALLPLLQFCVSTRPRAGVAVPVVAIGLAIFAGALALDAPVGIERIGPAVVAGGAVLAALGAGLFHQAELAHSHWRRVEAEVAAHRLIHRADELRVLSEVDPLTGLANRRSIEMRLTALGERAAYGPETVAVMMIDVDCFKQFNDRYGHPAGDRCLARVARAIGDQIRRRDDLVGRFGGEEFLAVLPGADLAVAQRVGERIRASVEQSNVPHREGTEAGVVTVSIGCAAGRVTSSEDLAELLRRADGELYVAKRDGRNRVRPAIVMGPDDEAATPIGRRAA